MKLEQCGSLTLLVLLTFFSKMTRISASLDPNYPLIAFFLSLCSKN